MVGALVHYTTALGLIYIDFDSSLGWLARIVEHTYSIDCCCCSWWLSVGKFGPLEALGKLWIDQRTTKLINAPVDYTLLVSSASSVASLGWVGWAELSAQSKTPLFLINLHYIYYIESHLKIHKYVIWVLVWGNYWDINFKNKLPESRQWIKINPVLNGWPIRKQYIIWN